MSFSLTKWYFDVTAADGAAAIAYCADVRWGRLRQPFSGVLVSPADGAAHPWRFSGRAVTGPQVAASSMRWSCAPLALSVEYTRHADSFTRRLYEGDAGVIDWHCVVPRGDACVRVGNDVIGGSGYAERLEMTLLPWRIPADEIRWGRLIAGDRSLVWIDWRGERPQSLLFLDGHIVPVASITDTAIECGDGIGLSLEHERVVSDDVLGGLLAPLETLRPLVRPIVRTHQTRWLSRGTLHGFASEPAVGHAMHEVVRRR